MRISRRLEALHPYPFERLNALVGDVTPAAKPRIAWSIGEPKNPAPDFVVHALSTPEAIRTSLGTYPATRGTDELKAAIANWCTRRFQLAAGTLGPAQALPVNGTREALFAFAQAMLGDANRNDAVLMPNPFYQIYEGAALLAGASPVYMPCPEETGYLPDLDAIPAETWKRCRLVYLCSPGNPSGAVFSLEQWQRLIALADEHDFLIAADECYSEIYLDESRPPVGLLQACAAMGRDDYARCVVFHSLSKRSNLPGLRSGFVAGDARLIAEFLRYRTYHGCAMAALHQHVSALAWDDETHVVKNRAEYRRRFDAVIPILQPVLDVRAPDASFYLWPRVPEGDEAFTVRMLREQNLSVLPGSYLSRPSSGVPVGADRVRMALVAPLEQCVEGAERIAAAMPANR